MDKVCDAHGIMNCKNCTSEYNAIRAERDALAAERDRLEEDLTKWMENYKNLKAENVRLLGQMAGLDNALIKKDMNYDHLRSLASKCIDAYRDKLADMHERPCRFDDPPATDETLNCLACWAFENTPEFEAWDASEKGQGK